MNVQVQRSGLDRSDSSIVQLVVLARGSQSDRYIRVDFGGDAAAVRALFDGHASQSISIEGERVTPENLEAAIRRKLIAAEEPADLEHGIDRADLM